MKIICWPKLCSIIRTNITFHLEIFVCISYIRRKICLLSSQLQSWYQSNISSEKDDFCKWKICQDSSYILPLMHLFTMNFLLSCQQKKTWNWGICQFFTWNTFFSNVVISFNMISTNKLKFKNIWKRFKNLPCYVPTFDIEC